MAPRLRVNRNAPYSSPGTSPLEYGTVGIEQISSLLQWIWLQRVYGLHRHGNATPARGSSMLTAESLSRQRNSDDGDGLHSAGTLARTCVLDRKHRILGKQAITARPANWHDMPGEYFECTRKLTA